MYNKTLDAFRMVAEEGSFSKAAEKMYITHTAVIKQVSGLETHLGVKLFHRTTHGVTLTPAGQALYTEALQIMKQSELSIQKVQQAHFASPRTLRIGTSTLYPCHFFMDLWDGIRDKCPGYSLKIVSFDDDHNYLKHIGESFDFIIGAYNREMEKQSYGFLPVGEYAFTLAVPRINHLSRRKQLSFSDLKGQPLMIMEKGTSPVNDGIRRDIQKKYPEINIVDIDPGYSVSTFNSCVERNSILLSLECWDRVHPDVKSIPLGEDYRLPFGIIYSAMPENNVSEFINAVRASLVGNS